MPSGTRTSIWKGCSAQEKSRLGWLLTNFFLSNLAAFAALGWAGVDVGFAYYVWVGIFGVAMLAQFWGQAANSYNVNTGQRLFPMIMTGATVGGMAGAATARWLFPLLGPWPLMALSMVILATTLPLTKWAQDAVPESSRSDGDEPHHTRHAPWLAGFGLVAHSPYLWLLAVMVVLLNCVNTTGEYILTEFVVAHADRLAERNPDLDKGHLLSNFYSTFYTFLNGTTLLLQVFLVARLFRWIGVHGAVLIMPVVALFGYTLAVFLPVFSVIQLVKILENSIDYSIMNTTRHALFLPLTAAEKFEAKTAIDTFFWRLGDVLQAGMVFAGVHWFGFGMQEFAMLNMGISIIWVTVAVRIAARYSQSTPADGRPVRWRFRPGRRRLLRVRAAAMVRLRCRSATRACLSTILGSIFLLTLIPSSATATGIFADSAPLVMELHGNFRTLCRRPHRKHCPDTAATLFYRNASVGVQRLNTRLRVRGRWRKETGNCTFPALFVFVTSAGEGSPFADHPVLPFTTHCRKRRGDHEQYVLKEYLAYRIYNLLTSMSLRVRLARVTYYDTSRSRAEPLIRYGFFTEHFQTFAKRHQSRILSSEEFNIGAADAAELGTFDLFQFMIGNTDWSTIAGHNVVHVRRPGRPATPVPYDFDFSGLVDARYAAPPPILPIERVTQRLFRGFCEPAADWDRLRTQFSSHREAILDLTAQVPHLERSHRAAVRQYLESFFTILESPQRRRTELSGACRSRAP